MSRLAAATAVFAFAWTFLRAGAFDWQSGKDFRSAPLPVSRSGKAGFTRLPPSLTGITFTNHLADNTAAQNQIRLNGSGVALGDVDGDGRCDLYFCRLEGPNALYRNRGGWKFEDIAASAGVACEGQFSTGATLADVDGDGDLDLLVNALGGGTRLFLNDGKGHFQEATDAGLIRKFASMSMALADIDGDGALDLYVANYRTTTVRSTGLDMLNVNGRRMLKPEDRDQMYITPDGFLREHGEVDAVYLNDGKGHFTALSWTDGRFVDERGRPLAGPPRDWGFSVMFRDINGDGAPDIYVCNDFWSPDRIWINDGKGKFRALARTALPDTSSFSMGVDFADINRDGFDDFIVLDMLSPNHVRRITQSSRKGIRASPVGMTDERPQVEHNTLFLNRGDGTFAGIADFAGLAATEWSWCPVFLDVDLDGYEDLLITTGYSFDTQDMDADERINARGPWPREKVPFKLLMYPPLPLPRKAFHNGRDLTFKEVGQEWGFCDEGVAQGMALADLDGDGDLDLVVNNLNGPAGIYRNESAAPRVAVRLKGSPPNTRGIGAKIWLYGGAVPMQSQEMICGGRYLSSDDPMRVFAAGTPTNEMRIEVRWRSGRSSIVNGVKANRIYEVDEAGAEAKANSQQPTTNNQQPTTLNPQPPVFADVSELIQHTHHEDPFDDTERQPLLWKKLSQSGPGVGWYDVDGDGWEDLIVASGRGGPLAVYRNDGHGGFQRMSGAPVSQVATRDQTGVLGWSKGPGKAMILSGSANYEDGLALGPCVRQYDLAAGTIDDRLPGQLSSTGPLALADLKGEGQLSLFVGGRVIAGRYPEAASSLLFHWREGKWEADVENTRRLAGVGMVSGAVFSDLDGDGRPELILACEWGPVRIFRNEQGKLITWDAPVTINNQRLTLDQLSGWWNGVTTGDLDGDGRMDIIASNWGSNTRYQSHRAQPLRVYYGEASGSLALVQSYYDAEMKKTVPEEGLDFVAKGLPFIRERVHTHLEYGQASAEEILGDWLKNARELRAGALESMIFFNRGDHFEAKPLPAEAQWAPAFAVCVGDYDGDGAEDVFLSQNFFAMESDTTRCDAGRGLWLRGDGKGGLSAVPGQESGVKVYGEQRGAALCDYDGDGRVDLVVTQNGAETKLYHNVRGRPGLRVRLKGPAGNPAGVGAQLRLMYGTGPLAAPLSRGGGAAGARGAGEVNGPVREIHAGSGYWSEDSVVQILGAPEPPKKLWVRWPGGKITTGPLPQSVKEIEADDNGQIRKLR